MSQAVDAYRWTFLMRSMVGGSQENVVAKAIQIKLGPELEMTPENMVIFVDNCIEEFKRRSLTPLEKQNETE